MKSSRETIKMNPLELPYIVEFFFALSTIVFVVTLYAILPALVFNKRTVFKPVLINSLWETILKNTYGKLEKVFVGHKKKEINNELLVIDREYLTVKIYK